jgi:multiple sugar transport system ATP-binding protein
MTLADRIIVMRAGEVEQVGSPMEIYSNPVSYFVADFFGSPSMNLLPGAVAAEGNGMRFRTGPFDVPLPGRFRSVTPGPMTLGIRPEHVRIASNGGAETTLPVRLVEPLGKDTLLYFDAGVERAFVAVAEGLSMSEVPVGARLGLMLDESNLHLFNGSGRRVAHR